MTLTLRNESECRWDLISLGEVMLRLDPGDGRIHTTRRFAAWEGGGEYNVARGLRRCFGKRTAVLTALADNPVGRLVEDLMLQGGVDLSLLRWVPYDGVGRTARNGLNFTERGFGPRAAVGCSDRGHTAVSQLQPGDFDLGGHLRPRTAPAGCTPAGSSARSENRRPPSPGPPSMPPGGTEPIVSYDLNYRDSLWRSIGGQAQGAGGQPGAGGLGRRPVRERGGLFRRARVRRRGNRFRRSRTSRRPAFAG